MSWITSVHDVSFKFFPNSGRYSVSKFSASISQFWRHITCTFFSRCLLLQSLIPTRWSQKLLWHSPPVPLLYFCMINFFWPTLIYSGWDLVEWLCRSRKCPGFAYSILRHSGIWGAADEAALNKVWKKIQKISLWKKRSMFFHTTLFLSIITFEKALQLRRNERNRLKNGFYVMLP